MVRIKSLPKSKTTNLQQDAFFYSSKRPNSESLEVTCSLSFDTPPPKKKKRFFPPELENLLNSYSHCLKIYKEFDLKSNNLNEILVTLDLPLCDDVLNLYQPATSFHLYFNDKDGLLLFYHPNSDNKANIMPIVLPDIFPILFMMSAQVFHVTTGLCKQNRCLNLKVHLKHSSIHNCSSFCDLTCLRQIDYSKVVNLFKTVIVDDHMGFEDQSDFIFSYEAEKAEDYLPLVNRLYDAIQSHHLSEINESSTSRATFQHPAMKCTLRNYQSDAIRWMIKQEQVQNNLSSEQSEILNSMFNKFYLNGKELYFSISTGRFLHKLPDLNIRRMGGILADEMGLGKTVEMVGLILHNVNKDWSSERNSHTQNINYRAKVKLNGKFIFLLDDVQLLCICGTENVRGSRFLLQCSVCSLWQHSKCMGLNTDELIKTYPKEYKCPRCWSKEKTPSKSTLIVSPDSIWQQWNEEIEKHVQPGSLNVYMYKGVSRTAYIQPETLANCDIVLTSYSILQREFCLGSHEPRDSDIESTGRIAKKYLRLSSPLLSILWWRVCFDEAQMIEKVTTQISKMAHQLEARYYWCVTGTPIQKCISDIYGLFCIFSYEPFNIKFWWNCLLLQPFLKSEEKENSLLVRLLTGLLWRNTKSLVADQLCLPSLVEKTHQLQLSAVERHLYEQLGSQSQESLQSYLQTLDDAEDNTLLSGLPQSQYSRLLNILSRLRQSCTHPSLVFKSDIFFLGKGSKSVSVNNKCLTMSEVLTKMIASRKKQCKDLCRSWVFFKNGAAGFYIIQKKFDEAARCYRDVLQSQGHISSYGVEIDSAQQLHILTNLSWLLNSHESDIDRVPGTDDNLLEKAQNLRKKFIQNFMESVKSTLSKLFACYDEQNSLIDQPGDIVSWLQEVLTFLDIDSLNLPQFSNLAKSGPSMNKYRNVSRSALINSYHELLTKRQNLHSTISCMFPRVSEEEAMHPTLEQDPHYKQIMEYSQCCMYRTEEGATSTSSSCPMCAASKALQTVRIDLSSASTLDNTYLGEDSVANKNTTLVAAVWEILRRLDSIKAPQSKICQRLVGFGRVLLKFLASIKQELSLSSRFLINLGDLWAFQHQAEQFTKRMQSNSRSEECYISEEEAIVDLEQSLNDATVHRELLERSLHQLAFLNQSASPSSRLYCAPCMRHMSATLPLFILLRCWHSMCSECFEIMRFMEKSRKRCPVCRQSFTRLDVERPIVTSFQESNQTVSQIKRSEHSSKVCEVVDCLKEIKENDPTAKSIVFSTWSSVLNTIHSALLEAGYTHASFMNARNSHELATFKWSEETSILLIPIHLGCNGLNLVEANHVLLVDPLLNPGHESQAIARIHRMGQTRLCTVHRFVALNTVEESLHYLHSKLRRETEDKNSIVGSASKEKVNITLGQFKELFFQTSILEL